MKKTLLGLFLIVTVTIGLTACGTENFSELKDDQARANYLGQFLDETENTKDEETMSSRIYNFSSFNEFEKTVFKDFKSQSETTKKMKAAGFKISRRYGNLKKYDDTTYAISSWTDISYKGESVQGNAVYHYFVVNGKDVKYDLINSYIYPEEIAVNVSHEHKEAPATEVSFDDNPKSFYGIAFGSTSEQVKYLMRTKGWTASSNELSTTVSHNFHYTSIYQKNTPEIKILDFEGGKYIDEDDFILSFFFYKDSLFQVSVTKQSNGKFNAWTEEYGYKGSKGEDVVKALKNKYNFSGNSTNKNGLDYYANSSNRDTSMRVFDVRKSNYIVLSSLEYELPPAYFFSLYDKKATEEVINYFISIVMEKESEAAKLQEEKEAKLKNAL